MLKSRLTSGHIKGYGHWVQRPSVKKNTSNIYNHKEHLHKMKLKNPNSTSLYTYKIKGNSEWELGH